MEMGCVLDLARSVSALRLYTASWRHLLAVDSDDLKRKTGRESSGEQRIQVRLFVWRSLGVFERFCLFDCTGR